MIQKINAVGTGRTIAFAVAELGKYMGMMNPEAKITVTDNEKANASDCLCVGCCEEFDVFLPPVEDKSLDDAVYINVKKGAGVITGTNPRSVLIAVYRYLRELGCAFIRPGTDNEIIPRIDARELPVYVCEAASYRHREVCIEGAVSYEHVAEMIDWIPKVAMNGYFIQFMKPYGFFRNWYNHEGNPYMEPEPKTSAELDEYTARLEDEIAQRDLIYFAVGHSWNSEPFGIEASYWDEAPEPPENIRKYLAQIDGRRDWFKGVPMNTNLCYSNKEVQEIITGYAADYCLKHPNVKYLVFWVADAFGNRCECDECSKLNFSDYYFQMLNLLDKKLTDLGLDTKIAFSVKATLPLCERINNPDRILMMFNPMLRNFTAPYPDSAYEEELPEIPVFPDNISFDELMKFYKADSSRYVALFKNWKNVYSGDALTYDYQLIWYVQRCPANILSAKTIYEDIKNHKRTGANGVNSCQVQRLFFPTGLPMVTMTETLWNIDAGYEEIADRYLNEAFGADSAKLYELLSRLDQPEIIRGICGMGSEEWVHTAGAETINMINQAYGVIDELEKLIEENVGFMTHPEAVQRSWQYLEFYPEFARRYMDMIMSSFGENDAEKTQQNRERLCDYVNRNEHLIHRVIDGFTFRLRMQEDFKKIGVSEDVHK